MTSRPVLYFLISVFSNLWYTLPFPRKQDSLDQKIPTFVIDCRLFRDISSGLILFNFRFQFRRKQLSVTSGEEAVRGEVELALDVVEADVEEAVVLLV